MPHQEKVMTQEEQQDALVADLIGLIDRYRGDWDLTYISVLGCLEVARLDLIQDMLSPDSE